MVVMRTSVAQARSFTTVCGLSSWNQKHQSLRPTFLFYRMIGSASAGNLPLC